MLKLITLLQNLKDQPRPLTDEESLYLDQIGNELRRATSDAARWRIFEREGLSRLDRFDFDDEVIAKLIAVRRAAMN
jgi:hypothetical protein